MNGRERIHELEERVEATTAWGLMQWERKLGGAFRVLEGNCRDLVQLADAYSAGHLQGDDNSLFVKGELFSCADRYLHNYLSSATTLRDHLRRYRDSYAPEMIAKALQEEGVKKFGQSNLAQFIESLRNFATHHELPLSYAAHAIKAGGVSTRVIPLDMSKLAENEGWTRIARPGAREYVKANSRSIVISTMAEEYLEIVRGFYEWLMKRHEQAFREEFDQIAIWSKEIEEITVEEQRQGGFDNGLSDVPYKLKSRFYYGAPAWLSSGRDRD